MVNEFIVFAHINGEGKLSIYNKETFDRKVDRLKNKYVEVTVRERSQPLQHNVRSYYFGVVVPGFQNLLHYLGDPATKAETDNLLRSMFLFKEWHDEETDTWHRELHTLRAGETEVTNKMMLDYCQKCITLAAGHGWEIAYPGEILEY